MGSLLAVPFHQQNTDKYCGAACAQMVLGALGRNVDSLSQVWLYSKSHVSPSGAAGWFSYPDGLTKTLNDVWKNAQGLRFLLYQCASKEDLLNIIRQTIENPAGHQAGPIVATGMNDHWVVVKGLETGPVPPDGSPPPIIGLHLNNPWPARNKGARWKHADADDCGSGWNKDWPCYFMSLSFWNDNMMCAVQEPGPWQGSFLAICLGPDPGTGNDHVIVPASVAGTGNGGQPQRSLRTPTEIDESVERLIASNPFAGIDCLNEALAGATPAAPLFVQEVGDDGMEREGSAYYVVPFLREGVVIRADGERRTGTQVPMLVIFNAYTGELEEAVGMAEGTTYDAQWLNPEVVSDRSSRAGVRQRESGRPVDAFPYRLVWRQSTATPTRFWPLLEGERGLANGRAQRVFTRIDGEVLTELEPLHG